MSKSREEILHMIRTGLRDTVPENSSEQRDFISEADQVQIVTKEIISNLKSQFVEELGKVNTNVLEAKDENEIKDKLRKIINLKKLKSFSIWESENLKKMKIKEDLKEAGLKVITAKNKNRIANSDIGITEVDYAIADTGTLVLLTGKNQPRSVSLLPPIHLAIVRQENMVRNIEDLFIILKSKHQEFEDLTSCMTFITGPSRTADIELNLTLGVHGPKELYVLIL